MKKWYTVKFNNQSIAICGKVNLDSFLEKLTKKNIKNIEIIELKNA